jgi:hypothetical protein
MHFRVKSTLKNNRYYTVKHLLNPIHNYVLNFIKVKMTYFFIHKTFFLFILYLKIHLTKILTKHIILKIITKNTSKNHYFLNIFRLMLDYTLNIILKKKSVNV